MRVLYIDGALSALQTPPRDLYRIVVSHTGATASVFINSRTTTSDCILADYP